MPEQPGQLTLLIRPGEKPPKVTDVPALKTVYDPGPVMRRVRTFFRPGRLLGKLILIGLPFWATSAVIVVGGAAAQWVVELFGSASTMTAAGLSTAATVALIPLILLGIWAGIAAALDLRDLGKVRRMRRAYDTALSRADEPDVLSPGDLHRPAVRESLRALKHMDGLLDALARDGSPVSGVIRDGLEQSHALVRRSVLDLIATERRLAEWSAKLGPSSSYTAQLADRRQALLAAYPGILDQCLHATDHGLAKASTDDPAELDRKVQQLLDRCRNALSQLEMPGPAIDEDELLLYAARERERVATASARPAERE